MLAVYVSGHGFGHAVRTGTVLRALHERMPDLQVTLVSTAPEEVAREAAFPGVGYRPAATDVGLVQRNALEIDEAGTAAAAAEFQKGYRRRVDEEAAWLAGAGARLVLGDVPPLAFDAAHAAGIPAVGLANFSWDWVYAHLAARQPALGVAAEEAAAAYAKAALLLELPFAGDLGAFPVRERIPLVARRPTYTREESLRRLGLEPGAPVVLVSFGGIGMPGLRLERLGALEAFRFLVTEGAGETAENVHRVDPGTLRGRGLGYADLVAASDVVLSKPGYGIVSDAIASGTRILYTERGDFPEYPVLVEGMARWIPAVHATNADVVAGRLEGPLRRVLALPVPEPPPLDGAEAAAARLESLLGGSGGRLAV